MEHIPPKRTKVVCTVGPAVDSEPALAALIGEGLDIARLNFGHGSRAAHLTRINRLKKLRRELGSPLAILIDLRGPRIRTGRLEGGKPIRLQAGKRIVLTEEALAGNAARIQQSCAGLAAHMKPGMPILIDDGLIELAVDEVSGSDIVCTVQNTGMLGEKKALNFPGTRVEVPILSPDDEGDLLFGIENEVDFMAVPCVRSAADVQAVRAFLEEHGGAGIGVVARIERPEAVRAVDEIIDAADGLIIARGDLGVELSPEDVPHVQKEIVRKCNEARTPVIIASQMLDSMRREPRPTRAEVADVANAVASGADAVMLSAETAIGKYSIPALRIMCKICATAEQHMPATPPAPLSATHGAAAVSPSVCRAAVVCAHDVGAGCIVTPTTSGRTARRISSLRPSVPIYAVTASERVMRRLQLFWGVTPMLGGVDAQGMRETIRAAQASVLESGLVKEGELAVVTAGDPETGPDISGDYAETSVMYVVQVQAAENGASLCDALEEGSLTTASGEGRPSPVRDDGTETCHPEQRSASLSASSKDPAQNALRDSATRQSSDGAGVSEGGDAR